MTSSTQPQHCANCVPKDSRYECSDVNCECHQPRQGWKENLKEYIDDSGFVAASEKVLIGFISTTLASERKALLEELLREMPIEAETGTFSHGFYSRGYNEALATIKSLIEKKLEI